MKRKVNRVGINTLTVSLPSKWAKLHNIKPGDEIDVVEEDKYLRIGTKIKPLPKSVTVDITGLDRSSIIYVVQNLYRRGFDEIHVIFKNTTTIHYRLQKEVTVISVIHKEVNRLVGVEVIQQKENSCIIKDISAESEKEFDALVKRVFFLMLDMSKDFVKGAKELDKYLISTIEEKHDSITKFISYCLRILNKKGYKEDTAKTILMYHILANLDKVTDVFKYSARDILSFKKKLNKETIKILEKIGKSVYLYYELFYTYKSDTIQGLWKNREETLNMIKGMSKKIPSEEILLVNKTVQALELIADLTGSRVGLEY